MRWGIIINVLLLGGCRDAPRVEQIAAPEAPAATAPPRAPEPVAVFEPDLTATLDKIAARVPKISWNSAVAIGVSWLPTARRWSIHGDEPQVMASIGKVVWTAAALTRAPVPDVEPLAVAAFAFSDNEGGASLIDLAGGADAVNTFTARTLSIAPTAMSLCTYRGGAMPRVAEQCHRIDGIDAFFTIHSSLTLLETIWRGAPPLDGERRNKLLQWSQLEPPLGFTMRRYLPKHIAVHHKRAEIPPGCCGKGPHWNWTSDVGIVESPRGPYALAISLSHGDSYPNQPETIEWASCVVYRAVVDEDDTTCPQPGS